MLKGIRIKKRNGLTKSQKKQIINNVLNYIQKEQEEEYVQSKKEYPIYCFIDNIIVIGDQYRRMCSRGSESCDDGIVYCGFFSNIR